MFVHCGAIHKARTFSAGPVIVALCSGFQSHTESLFMGTTFKHNMRSSIAGKRFQGERQKEKACILPRRVGFRV